MSRFDTTDSDVAGSGKEKKVTQRSGDYPAENLFQSKIRTQDQSLEVLNRPSISYWQDAWARLKTNKVAICSGFYIVLLSVAAIIVPEVIQYKYDETEIWNKDVSPTLGSVAVVISESGNVYVEETVDQRDSRELTEPPEQPAKPESMLEALTTGVAFRWQPVAGADGYRIYRSIQEDTLGIPLDEVSGNVVSYNDQSSLKLTDQYYYVISAFNVFGDSVPSVPLVIKPKLALSLGDARKIDPKAEIGATIKTNPHFLGTDYLGRDMLARVMMGARISLFIGFTAPFLYVLIGIIYGSISGFFGGIVDDFMMRVTDIVATVPELLVVILLQVVMGSGVVTLVIALVAVAWARSARQIRGEVLRLREMEFVHAAKVLGTPFPKIVLRHLLPNVMGTVLVVLTLAIPQAIFAEAFLSFIGLGISPPMASWGTVTKEGARVFLTYPHELIIPSTLISITILAFNLFGDGLRDALDPKLRGTS